VSKRRYQFSLRSFLVFVTACPLAVAAVVRIPHVVVFTLSVACVVLASRAAYRTVKGSRPQLSLVLASIIAWTVLYTLSLGPFIALSELEKKISGRYNVGRL
jgi:CDP-diglyceride synthetase